MMKKYIIIDDKGNMIFCRRSEVQISYSTKYLAYNKEGFDEDRFYSISIGKNCNKLKLFNGKQILNM